MKKISAVLAAILIYSSAFAIDTAAYTTEENINGVIVVDDINSASKISRLSISGKKATCKSTYSDRNSNISYVKIEQTLEKSTFGLFFGVSGTNWSKTVYSDYAVYTNSKANLECGTYRLKTVFTVKTKDGKTETITVYSDEKTVK
ncbi:MAG: hypothetical protein IJ784_05715 [Ruminiclostridium sp.]|nr:hypothetical protein [Ruminiclostridium sp.]MBR1831917.1 hypothetical protein [Ruminiclostridium sp.]